MKKKILVINNQMQLGGVCIAAKNFIENMYSDYDIEFVLAKLGGELINRLPETVKITNMPYPICCASMTRKESRLLGKKYYFRKCIISLATKSKMFSTSLIGKKLAKKTRGLEKNQYDVVINNDMDMSPVFVGSCHAYAKHIANAKIKCLVIHGDFVANNYDKKFFEKEYLPAYNYFIVLSEALRKQLEELFPKYKEKFVAIPNFQAVDEVKELAIKEEISFKNDVINILSASRLTEVKGLLRSLEVLRRLKSEGYKFVWHILGEGEDREKIEEFIALNEMSDCVKLYGAINNPYPYMKSADLLYLGSYHEAYGLVLIESMLLGRPVLTTNTISAKDIVSENYGWVCENTEQGIYEGFKEIFDNPSKLSYKTESLRNYSFDNNSIKEKYINLIEKG